MRWLFILFCLFLSSAFAQNIGKPFIKMGGAIIVFAYGEPTTNDISVSCGVHFNDHFSGQVGVNNIKFWYTNMDILTFSISPSYRVLKSKYRVSPVIGLDLGTQLWSNARGRFIEYGYHFTSYDPASPYDGGSNIRYKKGLFFGKLKLLADFKIKSFNLAIGPTLNSMFLKFESVQKYYSFEEGEYFKVLYEYIEDSYGFGAELSLMYTFPMNKRADKAVSDI